MHVLTNSARFRLAMLFCTDAAVHTWRSCLRNARPDNPDEDVKDVCATASNERTSVNMPAKRNTTYRIFNSVRLRHKYRWFKSMLQSHPDFRLLAHENHLIVGEGRIPLP